MRRAWPRAAAAETKRIGLAQAAHPTEELQSAVLAEKIASAGPLAICGAKRIMRMRAEYGLAAAQELSDALRTVLEWSADVDEGMSAQKEGRAPRFTGR